MINKLSLWKEDDTIYQLKVIKYSSGRMKKEKTSTLFTLRSFVLDKQHPVTFEA